MSLSGMVAFADLAKVTSVSGVVVLADLAEVMSVREVVAFVDLAKVLSDVRNVIVTFVHGRITNDATFLNGARLDTLRYNS